MKLSKNAKIVLSKFIGRSSKGKITEKPEAMFKRVAKTIAKVDRKYHQDPEKSEKEFLKAMENLEFLPSIPILANAGRRLNQLAACFVLPIPDNLQGIFEAVENMAVIQKSGGGTGFSFSHLRPEKSLVKDSGGVASGPVSFMYVFDCATGSIKEGGIRRGANMGVLNVEHPDIEKFIKCKDKGGFTNFNISVALTDKFMKLKDKKSKKLFNMVCQHAWLTGDPGILFIDTINKHNPTPNLGKIEASNPCGETPLLPYESCILGSINLEKVVDKGTINYPKLARLVELSIHFLDNCIDATSFPLTEIEHIVRENRKIGLGVMGFANMLVLLGIRYDSKQAVKLAKELMSFIQSKAHMASNELAEKRGEFPNFQHSTLRGSMKMRNATCTTIAPTGTIAIIADTSPGIEPIFDLVFKRHTHFGTLIETNPLLKKIKNKKLFVTAHQVPSEYHVKIQAAFQKYTDNAVSKTVNLPTNAKVSDIKKIFLLAHKLGCKGLTIYRHKSKPKQVLDFCPKCK